MNLLNECSLKDTKILRDLILENPDLPLIIFCGEDAWDGDSYYNQGYASRGEVEYLTLYNDKWLNEDDYEEELINDLSSEVDYQNLTDEEYFDMIKQKVEETEFVKAIVIYVG